MKKTYLIPTIDVVEVKMEQLLDVTSLGKDNKTTISSNDAVLGRGGSDWDDEY